MKTWVTVSACDTYELDKVEAALETCLAPLGGIGSFAAKGDRILLKPNLLMAKSPDEAVTTHPVVIRAMVRLLKNAGACVVIGDSPGGPFNARMLKKLYRQCGLLDIAQDEGVALNYNTEAMEVTSDTAKLLKRMTLTAMLQDVDKVISIAKFKTHQLTTLTGAVKNLFGMVPGILKMEYHLKMRDVRDFSNALIDVSLAVKPVLSIMDGVMAMEGEGPSAGVPRKLGVILASPSPYHLDVVMASIAGIDPGRVPTVACAAARGLCAGDLSDIELSPGGLEPFMVKDFRLPGVAQAHKEKNTWLHKLLRRMFWRTLLPLLEAKPIFNPKACTLCRTCAETCPAQAITMQKPVPQVALDKCIRCFCCQELCPSRAVRVHRPLLMRFLGRL